MRRRGSAWTPTGPWAAATAACRARPERHTALAAFDALPHRRYHCRTMEQQIRFCTTTDGVRIAYATVGQGPPLVRALGWFTHLEYEWENPRWRRFYEPMASRFTYIRYDGRGMGLSDRDVTDFSVDRFVH